jgi:hypothetical protein
LWLVLLQLVNGVPRVDSLRWSLLRYQQLQVLLAFLNPYAT